MKSIVIREILPVLLVTCALSHTAHAHLMAAQHGTLNFVGNGAFMVLSVPTSAFSSIDTDGDGRLSTAEFNDGRAAITASIKQRIRLLDSTGARPLAGVMLAAVAPHKAPKSPADQIIVMGRFALDNSERPMKFEIDLFGKNKAEKSFQIRFSRKNKTERDVLTFTQGKSAMKLFEKF